MRRNSVNPVNRKGLRIIDCPFYGDCLMTAAKLKWEAWTCEECQNRNLTLVRQELKFIAPYYKLLAEIYPEFKKEYEPLMNALHPEL